MKNKERCTSTRHLQRREPAGLDAAARQAVSERGDIVRPGHPGAALQPL